MNSDSFAEIMSGILKENNIEKPEEGAGAEGSSDTTDNTVPAPPVPSQETTVDTSKGEQAPADEDLDKPTSDAQTRLAGPKSRDYTGLTPAEVKVFKSMSNEAYNYLRPLYDKWKQKQSEEENLKKQIEELSNRHWYEFDGAYKLSDDYKTLAQNLESLTFEENYWKEQLARAESGQPVELLTDIDENGQYVVGEPQEPTPQIKAQLIAYLTKAQALKDRVSSELTNYEKTFKTRIGGFYNQLNELDKIVFGKLDMNNPNVKAAYDKWAAKMPSELRGHKAYDLLIKSMVAIEGLISRIAASEQAAKVKNDVRRTQSSTGPSAGFARTSNLDTDVAALDEAFKRLTSHR